jgi:hypothetical protein
VVTAVPGEASAKPVGGMQPAVEPARPGDWRQSWGKVERYTAPPETKTASQIPARPVLPHAEVRSDDPLKHPELYGRVQPQAGATVKSVRYPSQMVSQEPVLQPAAGTTVVGSKKEQTAKEKSGGVFAWMFGKPKSAKASAQPAGGQEAPLGMGSVAAARSPQLYAGGQGPAGPSAVSVPDGPNAFGTPQAPPPPQMPFNAFGTPQAPTGPYGPGYPPMMGAMPPGYYPPMRAPYPPMPPSMPPRQMVMDSNTPEGLGNAFTATNGTSRPIPADFGPPQQVGNAFLDPSAALATGMPAPRARTPQTAMQPAAFVPAPRPGYLPAAAPEMGKGQLLAALRDSLYPSEREVAAERLAGYKWQSEPEVVQALVQAARHDPAPLVRAGCVRSLGRMKANTIHVVNAVQALKADTDPRVRQEVEQALPVLLAP